MSQVWQRKGRKQFRRLPPPPGLVPPTPRPRFRRQTNAALSMAGLPSGSHQRRQPPRLGRRWRVFRRQAHVLEHVGLPTGTSRRWRLRHVYSRPNFRLRGLHRMVLYRVPLCFLEGSVWHHRGILHGTRYFEAPGPWHRAGQAAEQHEPRRDDQAERARRAETDAPLPRREQVAPQRRRGPSPQTPRRR